VAVLVIAGTVAVTSPASADLESRPATDTGALAGAAAARVATPGAPRAVVLRAKSPTSIKVSFTKPAFNGGARITKYAATCTSKNGGVTRSGSAARSPISINRLTAAARYSCTVRAINKVGAGARSTVKTITMPRYSALAVEAGSSSTCAVVSDGTLRCWGVNSYGETGSGGTTGRSRAVAGVTGARQVSMGYAHTCVRTATGTVRCFGFNSDGQLGRGTIGGSSATPTTVTGLTGVTMIAAGTYHTCAVHGTGQVSCWGDNERGQLGDGTTTDRAVPTAVVGLAGDVRAVSAGRSHTCALLTSGAVQCWGDNSTGQLGTNAVWGSPTPLTMPGATGVSTVAAGDAHTCLSFANGAVRCTGNNGDGQLGDGTATSTTALVSTAGIISGVMADAAMWNSCARLDGGAVRCWGDNTNGEVGNGASGVDVLSPAAVLLSQPTRSISVGVSHSCAVMTDSSVRCWGSNGSGQMGIGSIGGIRSTPVRVADF
jgi:alpha-tubulin suppressor-like RCC1 family protein